MSHFASHQSREPTPHREAPAELPKYALEIDNVSLQRGEKVILQNVSLRVPIGATCAIVGHNGSGKSTLLRVIEGYEFPTSGTVRILGETLGETDVARLRERVRLVGAAGMSSGGG